MTMLDYINEQPELFLNALEKRDGIVSEAAELFIKEKPDALYLIASGTSRNAALAASYFLKEVLRLPVFVESSASSGRFLTSSPFAVFISQGGCSTNTVDAIARCGDVPSFAVTGNPKGKVNDLCKQKMIIPCGEENIGPKTKGYTMTILSLYLWALSVAKETGRMDVSSYERYITSLSEAGSSMAKNIAVSTEWAEANWESFSKPSAFFLVGKGVDQAIAAEGALKMMETILKPSVSFEFEEYLHGPVCSIGEDVSGLYLLPSSDKDETRISELAAIHGKQSECVFTIKAGDASFNGRELKLSSSDEWYLRPFSMIIPMQLLSAIVPAKMGIEGLGMKRFYAIDDVVKMKYKVE